MQDFSETMSETVKYDWLSIIKINIWNFKLVGLWPGDEGYKLDFYLLRSSIIVFVFAFILTGGQTLKLMNHMTDLEVVARTAYMIISFWLMFAKMYSIARNIQPLRKLLRSLNDDIFQVRTQEQIDNISPSIRIWNITYILITACIASSVTFWAIFSFSNRRLPFTSWYPYNTTVSPMYEVTCIHQLASLFFQAYVVDINMDTFIAAFSLYAAVQFDILCDNVKRLKPEGFREGLISCVKHHRAIVKYVTAGFTMIIVLTN